MDETTAATTQPIETVPETAQPVPAPTEVPEVETADPTLPQETLEAAAPSEPAETLDYEIPETLEMLPQETVAMTTVPTEPIIIEVIARSTSDIVHASLFGAFLICGTLVGIFMLRGIN